MTKRFENKSIHNQSFLDTLCNDYPEEYFDWKVTIMFYIALHKCYCVMDVSNVNICTNHKDNFNNLKTIDSTISNNLYKLFKSSRQSRYDGFINEDAMLRINKINFNEGKNVLKMIENDCTKYYPVSV